MLRQLERGDIEQFCGRECVRADNVAQGWGIMGPTTWSKKRRNYSSFVLCVIPKNPSGGSGKDSSWRMCSKKGVYCPTGKLVKLLNTFESSAKFSKKKRVEAMIGSIMGTDCVSFWRNRDMVLVQGRVDYLR